MMTTLMRSIKVMVEHLIRSKLYDNPYEVNKS